MIQDQDFEMYQGETKDIVITISDDNGNVLDVSGSDLEWEIKNYPMEKKTIGNGVQISDATNGKIQVSLNSADTQDRTGTYIHRAKLTDSMGNVSVVLRGTIRIMEY